MRNNKTIKTIVSCSHRPGVETFILCHRGRNGGPVATERQISDATQRLVNLSGITGVVDLEFHAKLKDIDGAEYPEMTICPDDELEWELA